MFNKCIGDDTIAAAATRQSQTALKTKKIWRKTIFNMVDGFDGILTPCNVAWVSGIVSEFTKWQHPAM